MTQMEVDVSHSQRQDQHERVETSVFCGCRPRASKSKWKRYKKKSTVKLLRSKSKYYDVEQSTSAKIQESENDDDSLFFFDAVESPLRDDEYPPVFTTTMPHPKLRVTLEDPATLLKSLDTVEPQLRGSPMESHRRKSRRFVEITRRSTMEHTTELEQPRVPIEERGYPGGLSMDELGECQNFLRGLKMLNSDVMEQVYSFRDVEEEPYTICRWLRATKFKADAILQRLDENQDMFARAQRHDFYPDPSRTIGAPVSVFLSQYPFLPIGSARNGCPVNYFMAGKIHPEGIMAMTTVEKLEGYFWWSFMWKMKNEMRRAKATHPDFVRMEGINIVDLKGLSSSALSSETIEVIKVSGKVADFFPETLHCMLILNAPGFFSFSWSVIKKFIDARTAARIQVFSSEEKGLKALGAMIDQSEIPEDYGGTNISTSNAFAKQASDPTLIRQQIELVYVKRGKQAKTRQKWTLKDNEVMTVRVYTRSVSPGCITVFVNDESIQAIECSCKLEPDPKPNSVRVAVVKGPCVIVVEVQDLDKAGKQQQSLSRGYFLVVGDVKMSKSKSRQTKEIEYQFKK